MDKYEEKYKNRYTFEDNGYRDYCERMENSPPLVFKMYFNAHSRLQRQVLTLYKDFLKTIRAGDKYEQLEREFRANFRQQAAQFQNTDVVRIEAAIRRGRRRLELIQSGSVTSFQVYKRQ
ncbi:succinate dehydrogenase complex assembly factor 1 [Cichlidogyrus casuarinus]|uniref:Succinate dehydrogenase complex assembly factor 1 n=1 Tax=Cichlidogyrus casuarinus TaxID=1844966 RepID=A0ABD2PNQ1_9PLAT